MLVSEGLVLLACRVRFLSYVHFVWQAWKSKTSFRVTGAGVTLFHPCGRRGASYMLLKRWQAWVKRRVGFGGNFSLQAQYLVNLDDVLKGSNVSFWETVVIFACGHADTSTWRCSTSDTSGSFLVAGAVPVNVDRKVAETW